MDFNLTPEEETFRDEVRSFIQEHLSPEARKDPNLMANWLKSVREKRWVGFNWPPSTAEVAAASWSRSSSKKRCRKQAHPRSARP